jgi:hypothetical protein
MYVYEKKEKYKREGKGSEINWKKQRRFLLLRYQIYFSSVRRNF